MGPLVKEKYLRMLRGLRPGGEARWSVYILRCAGGTLYTGVTTDVDRRVRQHNAGHGAAYTRSHRPVRLVYAEKGHTRSSALMREAQIKRGPRVAKLALVHAGLLGGKRRRINVFRLPTLPKS